MSNNKSYFDGKLIPKLALDALSFVVNFFSIGLAYPWVECKRQRWETKHTIIDGKRLKFNGNAVQLYGNYIKWWALSVVTLGIYALTIKTKVKRWTIKHTHME